MKKLLLISIIIALLFCVEISSASSIHWYDYEEGISIAEKSDKPMMIYFDSDRNIYKINFDEPQLIEALNKFICIKINVEYAKNLTAPNNILAVPTIVFINTKKQEILRVVGADSSNLNSKILEAWNKKDEIGQPFQLIENGYKKEIYNLGKVTIKEYNSESRNLNVEKSANVEDVIKAEINAVTIRKLSGPDVNSIYTLTLDDGTDTMSITYKGGLGDIGSGDKVDVKIDSNKIIEISKSNSVVSQHKTTSGDETTSKTTPSFGLIAGVSAVFTLFFILKKMRD